MMSVVDVLVTSMKPLFWRSTPGLVQVMVGTGRPVMLTNRRREPPARKQIVFLRSSWSSKSGGSIKSGWENYCKVCMVEEFNNSCISEDLQIFI